LPLDQIIGGHFPKWTDARHSPRHLQIASAELEAQTTPGILFPKISTAHLI
jgi:hypothetical protein